MDRRKLNQENLENKDNKKKLFILLGVLALLVVVGSVIAIKNRNNKQIEETPKETVLETVKESEEETTKESSKKENKKEENKKVTQNKDDNKKVKEEVKEDGTVIIESEDEKGNKVVTKIKDNKVEKTITDKSGKTKTEKSNINDKENSGLKTKVKEVVKEKEKSVASKPSTPKQNTKVEKPKENKVTKPSPSKPKETKKEDVITTKRITTTESIPYNTIDRYASTGAKSRVEVAGRNGVKTYTIEVTYKNGVEVSRKTIGSEITSNPKDQVIARYINEPKQVEKTIEVEDESKPVYGKRNRRDRWFVRYKDGSIKYFYNQNEAYEEYGHNPEVSNWGTAEPEYDTVLIGYETITKTVTETVDNYVWKY